MNLNVGLSYWVYMNGFYVFYAVGTAGVGFFYINELFKDYEEVSVDIGLIYGERDCGETLL